MTTPTPSRSFKAKRRKHTKEFKQEAVALARRADIGFARAAKDLGIHRAMEPGDTVGWLKSWGRAA